MVRLYCNKVQTNIKYKKRIQLCYCNNSNNKYNNGSDINAYYVNDDKTNNAHDINIGNEKKKQ